MDMIAWAGSFLLGGISAVTIMGLLLFFIENPLTRSHDSQYLKRIADSLVSLTEFRDAEKTPSTR
jgi:hypothetical protein